MGVQIKEGYLKKNKESWVRPRKSSTWQGPVCVSHLDCVAPHPPFWDSMSKPRGIGGGWLPFAQPQPRGLMADSRVLMSHSSHLPTFHLGEESYQRGQGGRALRKVGSRGPCFPLQNLSNKVFKGRDEKLKSKKNKSRKPITLEKLP